MDATTCLAHAVEARVPFLCFTTLLKDQIARRQSVSFPLWTVMNAVLRHASWIEGREDCL
jgi:hypothetical protein